MENKLKVIIAAVSIDGVIGIGDEIPWRIPEDFKHFRETTLNHTLIVGYNTYLTLPDKAFEKRKYFVLNGGKRFETTKPNVFQYESIKDVLYEVVMLPDEKVFVIGGASIYNSFIDICDEAIITWVNKIYPEGDKEFPVDKLNELFEVVDGGEWLKSKNDIEYRINHYKVK